MANDVSSTRLYLGNLPRNATKADVENHFASHDHGKITEVKLMNGFGFVEYEDPMDARDVVPAFHGTDFMGERLVVQFARGSRREKEGMPYPSERPTPRPRRTPYRMSIRNLPVETSWQDLKDFARQSGLDVVYSEVGRDRDGRGFVEYETAADLRSAVEKLDGRDFKGTSVACVADEQPERPAGGRYRSRSPPPAGGYRRGPPPGGPPGGGYYDDYERRGPPRGWSPRREDYRRRSPPRDYYERDRWGGSGRSPPPGRRGPPPMDDGYGPPRGRYPDDPYDARGGPPAPRGRYDEPYGNGHGRPPYAGGGPPSPRGRRSPGGRPPYPPAEYDRQARYW